MQSLITVTGAALNSTHSPDQPNSWTVRADMERLNGLPLL